MKHLKLDEVAINAMMKKSIEEVVNHWKGQLDSQVARFTLSSSQLREFECKFLKSCDSVTSLFELTNALREETESRKRKLEDLSRDEDTIIEQLTLMDKELDQYITLLGQNHPEITKKFEEGGDVYSQTQEISSTMKEVQADLNELNQRVSAPLQDIRGTASLSFEGPNKEKVTLEHADFTAVLNSYYDGLRSIQMMEQHLSMQLQGVEEELKERMKPNGENRFYEN